MGENMNEPVAWMVDGVLFNSLGAALNISFDIKQPCIPLYTHPAKTLTMAEMEDFINAYGMDMGDRYEFTFAQLTKMIVEIEHQIKGEK